MSDLDFDAVLAPPLPPDFKPGEKIKGRVQKRPPKGRAVLERCKAATLADDEAADLDNGRRW